MSNLASLLKLRGKFAESELFFRRVLQCLERSFGRDHPDTLVAVGNLGFLLQNRGGASLSEAEQLLQRSLEGHERTLGDSHPGTKLAAESLRRLRADRK